jgi:hypothetical protein
MSENSEKSYYPVISPETIREILAVILDSPYPNSKPDARNYYDVHYIGYADEGLIRAMIDHRGQFSFSVMDIPDRWDSNMRFWWADDYPNEPCPEAPEWLNGVVFYMDGASFHEIGLRDKPWDNETQLHRIIHFPRPPAAIIVLFGHADMDTDHPAYDWENRGSLRVGYWKGGLVSGEERRTFVAGNENVVGKKDGMIPNCSTRSAVGRHEPIS